MASGLQAQTNVSLLNVLITGKQDDHYGLSLTSLDGTEVIGSELQSNAFLSMDVSELSAGIYVLKITSENNEPIYTEKIVILK